MTTFAELKKNRKSNIDKYVEQAEKLTKGSFERDERYWEPTADKAGNGGAVIRFLPTSHHKGEEHPFVQYWTHSFKHKNGRWYIENCRSTIGEADPVMEFNTKLWEDGAYSDDSPERKQARNQKRKLFYVSNILVIDDPANPENNGKVFLFRYGKKIFDMLMSKMKPNDPLGKKKPVDPFDLWEGCDFNLIFTKKDNFRNYDDSDFDAPTPIASSDEEIEKIWKMAYPLQPEVAPDKFKSYSELRQKMNWVLGLTDDNTKKQEKPNLDEDEDEGENPFELSNEDLEGNPVETEASEDKEVEDEPKPKTTSKKKTKKDDEDDPMKFFEDMAED